MRLAVHIVLKDARHLWKEIVVTWVLLAWLTYLDSVRSGYQPDAAEGWLNILLPLAWCWLAGLCVLQDPVPGERQFWIALPLRHRSVIAAKALFVLAMIHLPYLVSNAVVLSARGFNPIEYLPRLLEKQLLVLIAITLPSLALASVVQNAMQFIVCAIAIFAAALVSDKTGTFSMAPFTFSARPWMDETRLAIALSVLALASLVLLNLQYRSRRTLLSRYVGLAAIMVSGLVSVWLPLVFTAKLAAAWRPATQSYPLTIRLKPGVSYSSAPFASGGVNIAIPVEPLSRAANLSVELLALEIETPDGRRIKANPAPGNRAQRESIASFDRFSSPHADFVALVMERGIYKEIGNLPVTVRGDLIAEFHREGMKANAPAETRVDVPTLGLCTSSNAFGSLIREGGIRLECESPREIPHTPVILIDSVTTREWKSGLGQASAFVSHPTNTLLSPLFRKEAYFQLTWRDTTRPGSQWQVPQEVASHYRMEIEPQPVTGRAVIPFELRDIRLNESLINHSK